VLRDMALQRLAAPACRPGNSTLREDVRYVRHGRRLGRGRFAQRTSTMSKTLAAVAVTLATIAGIAGASTAPAEAGMYMPPPPPMAKPKPKPAVVPPRVVAPPSSGPLARPPQVVPPPSSGPLVGKPVKLHDSVTVTTRPNPPPYRWSHRPR
jgi:hypothetical protein